MLVKNGDTMIFATYILPLSGIYSPVIIRKDLTFPAPFTPTMPSLSPSLREKLIPSKTVSPPKEREIFFNSD